MGKFFSKEAKGIKSDIERHRGKEKYFAEKIEDAESCLANNPNDLDAQRWLRVYRGFMSSLQDSKAEAVNKLGRKGDRK